MIGQTVSHYRIKKKLGGGGMGVVYLAEDTRLDRPVAIKFLPPAFFGDSVAERRFEQEAKAAAALNHPHICTVHDVGQHEGRPYLVMEFLHGQTLKHRLMQGEPLTIEEILDLGIQIASGLEQAHGGPPVRRRVRGGHEGGASPGACGSPACEAFPAVYSDSKSTTNDWEESTALLISRSSTE